MNELQADTLCKRKQWDNEDQKTRNVVVVITISLRHECKRRHHPDR